MDIQNSTQLSHDDQAELDELMIEIQREFTAWNATARERSDDFEPGTPESDERDKEKSRTILPKSARFEESVSSTRSLHPDHVYHDTVSVRSLPKLRRSNTFDATNSNVLKHGDSKIGHDIASSLRNLASELNDGMVVDKKTAQRLNRAILDLQERLEEKTKDLFEGDIESLLFDE